METTRVQYGTTERIFAPISNSSGDPITGLTDVLIDIYRKSDGKYYDFNDSTFKSSGWTTRQQVMTELSSTYSPGVYYYDFDTTGQSSSFVEEDYLLSVSSATAANDPLYGELKVGGYVDQIGISGGVVQFGKGKGMSESQIKKLAEMVWQVVLRNDKTAAETLLSKSEFNAATDKVLTDINIPEFKYKDRTDEIISAMPKIIPPKDYSIELSKILDTIQSIKKIKLEGLTEAVVEFNNKMESAAQDISLSKEAMQSLNSSLSQLKETMTELQYKTADVSDMDRRFEKLSNSLQKQQIEDQKNDISKLASDVNLMMRKILKSIVDQKYEILNEIK